MNDFEYGLLARSIFITLLWLTALLGFVAPELLPWHIGLLLFLGLGLKPLLLKTGVYLTWMHWLVKIDEFRHAASDAENALRLERKRRDDKLRKARKLSSELPRNW